MLGICLPSGLLTASKGCHNPCRSPLQQCWSVQKLYLYENRLTAISGLTGLNQLTHLYLQVMVTQLQPHISHPVL